MHHSKKVEEHYFRS